jgi:hypothetical protein
MIIGLCYGMKNREAVTLITNKGMRDLKKHAFG